MVDISSAMLHSSWNNGHLLIPDFSDNTYNVSPTNDIITVDLQKNYEEQSSHVLYIQFLLLISNISMVRINDPILIYE